jgi:hypothetical protein
MRENKDPTKKLTGFVRRTKRNIHGEINYGFGQKNYVHKNTLQFHLLDTRKAQRKASPWWI